MTTYTKGVVALIGAVVIGLAIAGGYYYPKAFVSVQAGSPAGSTFNTAKFAGVVANLAAPGTTGTTTSVLNSDAGDRYVTGVRYACNVLGTSKTAYTGADLANLTLSIGTSSTAGANSIGATAKVLTNGLIPTTTPQFSTASSTAQLGVGGTASIWHTGEYMNFQTNATNTAVCTFGVDYIGS